MPDPILEWIDTQYMQMIAKVEKWSRINSWSDHLSGLNDMLAILLEEFAILNGEQSTVAMAPRKSVSNQGAITEKATGQALSIKKRPKAPIQVLLSGHLDTVYAPTHPFQEVQRLDSETLRGPGVTDMKGGLVIMLKALEAFERSPHASSIGWEVFISPDEEVGSPSSSIFLAEAAKRHHVGLVFEPSFADGAFVSKRKGSANYTIVAKGKAAHAGREYGAGRSAIYAIADLINELEKLNDPDKGITLNVGYIEGGGPVNIVPELAMCRLNVRANSAQEMAAAILKMNEILKRTQQKKEVQLTLIEENYRQPKPFDEKTEMLFQHYQQCAEQLQLPFQLRESGGVTDGNTLAAAGLPTIDSIGAIGGNIHTDEEFLHLPSLTQRAKLTTLYLLKLANKEWSYA